MESANGSEDEQNLIKDVLSFEMPEWVRRVQQRIAESSTAGSDQDPLETL